jgi:type II restriction enzyme
LIAEGFASIEDFTGVAKSVLARRKSRRGRSFELQMELIFREEEISFSSQARINRKQVDFVFPSSEGYQDEGYPTSKLRMLSLKSTLRERWDGIVKEAPRIPHKHLLTLQEGAPASTLETMKRANVSLVVPDCLIKKYPQPVRGELVALSQFIAETRELTG